MNAKPVLDEGATLPPPLLSLTPGSALDTQAEWIPFTERLLRLEDVDGLAGAPIVFPDYVPVDLFQVGSYTSE